MTVSSPRPAASPATLQEARRLYETSELPQAEIGRRLGLSPSSLSRMAKRDGWRRPAAAQERAALVRRVRAKVDREIEAVEKALGGEGAADAAERAARTLASLVKTLRELALYDEQQAKAAGCERGAGVPEDDGIADIDALRDALARRLEGLRGEPRS
jgi:hypothetical protein